MPDINGNYLGDRAGVLPDYSANVLHMADQYAVFNQQKAMQRQAQAAADAKRNQDYYKLIGDNFDPTKFNDPNPYHENTTKDIANTQQKYLALVSGANNAGRPLDEGMLRAAMTQDLARIKGNDDLAKQKALEIREAVKALEKEPGIDTQKLLGLALNEYFNSADPETGEVGMNPAKWEKGLTGADKVKQILEKYPAVLGTNQGVDEDFVSRMKAAEATDYKVPAILNEKTGQEIAPGYDIKLKHFQQINYDKNGIPEKIDIRQEPVFLPNGEPLRNPDGTQKMTIAKDLEEEALSHLGFAINVKKDLQEAIGQENMRRQAINENLQRQGLPPTLQMITGDSEEAKVMNSDIILNRLRNIMQGGGIDIKENKNFENRLKVAAAAREEKRLDLAERRAQIQEEKLNAILNGKSNDLDDVESPLVILANSKGKTIKVNTFVPGDPFATKEVKVVYKNDVDPKQMEIIEGGKPKTDESYKFGATKKDEFKPFEDANGRQYWEVDDNGNWIGQNGQYDAEATRDALIKTFTKDDLPMTQYSKKRNKAAQQEKKDPPKSTSKSLIERAKKYFTPSPKKETITW